MRLKIAYDIEVYGMSKHKVIACKDVKHSSGPGFDKLVAALKAQAAHDTDSVVQAAVKVRTTFALAVVRQPCG